MAEDMRAELTRIATALESIALNEATKLGELRDISQQLHELVRIHRSKP